MKMNTERMPWQFRVFNVICVYFLIRGIVGVLFFDLPVGNSLVEEYDYGFINVNYSVYGFLKILTGFLTVGFILLRSPLFVRLKIYGGACGFGTPVALILYYLFPVEDIVVTNWMNFLFDWLWGLWGVILWISCIHKPNKSEKVSAPGI